MSAAEAAANAVSTTVSFEVLDDSRRRIQIDQRPLGCEENALAILEPTAIAIEGIGSIVVEPQIKRILHLAYSRRRSISKAFSAAVDALRAVVEAERSRPDGQWQRLETQTRVTRPLADLE